MLELWDACKHNKSNIGTKMADFNDIIMSNMMNIKAAIQLIKKN